MSEPTHDPTSDQSPHAAPAREPSVRLASALRALVAHTQARPPARDLTEALAYLERDVEEVRTRVNALFFAVLLSALSQLVMKVFA